MHFFSRCELGSFKNGGILVISRSRTNNQKKTSLGQNDPECWPRIQNELRFSLRIIQEIHFLSFGIKKLTKCRASLIVEWRFLTGKWFGMHNWLQNIGRWWRLYLRRGKIEQRFRFRAYTRNNKTRIDETFERVGPFDTWRRFRSATKEKSEVDVRAGCRIFRGQLWSHGL